MIGSDRLVTPTIHPHIDIASGPAELTAGRLDRRRIIPLMSHSRTARLRSPRSGHRADMAQRDQSVEAPVRRPSFGPAGVLLGIGLGGFIDGILLHQILQWHHMISHDEPVDTVLGLERNTLWDGLFHAFTWAAVLVGLVLFARQVARAARPIVTRPLWGWILIGWGLFNVVEGLINHHLLQVHHVRDDVGAPLSWDLGFLAFGAALMIVGWLLARQTDLSGPTRR